MTAEYEFHVVDSDALVQVRARRVKRRIPVDRIVPLMLEGKEIFIPDIDRRKAWYICKRLEKAVGLPIEYFPAQLKGMNGYIFKIKMINVLLQKMLSRIEGREGKD